MATSTLSLSRMGLMFRSVSIASSGRSGSVTYHEGSQRIDCYWEFGGAEDVVAIVQCGTAEEWSRYPWALDRRDEILGFIADEVIRQQAPTCVADIDGHTGDILLRPRASRGKSRARAADGASWMTRLSRLRARLGLGVLLVALAVAGGVWFRRAVMIDPGKSAPIGFSFRTDRHVATLLQTLVPYVPMPNRDHSKDMYRISVLVTPLDGSAARVVPIEGSVSASVLALAKVLGVQGDTLWFRAGEIGAVDLSTYSQVVNADASRAAALPQPTGLAALGPKVEHHLGAGLLTSPAEWLGVHTEAEVAGEFRPTRFVKRVERADVTKLPRRLYRGVLDADAGGPYHRILSMTPIGNAEYVNAAFLRPNDTAEPPVLADPAGVVMVFNTDASYQSTVSIARVNMDGTLAWSRDTGIDRFLLQQILPGNESTVLIGPRPAVPNKVSEPLMVIVPHATGALRVESLWR